MICSSLETFELKVGTKRIKTTANHPFYALINYKKDGARRGRYRKEWRYLSDLKVGDLVGVARQIPFEGEPHAFESSHELTFRHNEVNIPKLSTDDLMWFMGLYLGDGFLHKEKNKARVEIAIPKEDIQLREALLNVVNNIFGMEASSKDKDRITIYSTILAKFIEEIGFGGKAYTKKIPQWVFSLPKTQILSFLGGYLDSDGYVRDHPKNHDVVFTSVNKKILEDTKVLTLSCGLQSSEVHEFKSKHVYDKNRHITAYRMEISGDASVILCRSEKRFLRFGKKKFYHKCNSAGNTSFRTHVNEFIGFAKIESIEPSGIKPVYDIEVENYHNFIAEGIIVHNSELVYHKIRKDLEDKGVIFLGMDDGLKQYPEIVKKYFGTVIPFNDNKLAALNSAVWSGGSFVYVPAGVKVDLPLQAYFRINAKNAGQFERTLIIAEPGSSVHYVEGCFEKGATIKTLEGIKKIVEIGRGRHEPKDVEFPIETDKDFFRLVGYYMAEGSTIGENYLTFTFNKKERDYIDDVKELLEKYFGKAPIEQEEYKNGISIVLCSTLAARLFKQEFGKGAKNKSLPNWFMLELPEKQAEFVKGYWRGDGNFFSKKYSWGNKRMFRINTISNSLAEQTRDLLLRLNIFASINAWNRKTPRSNSFIIYV